MSGKFCPQCEDQWSCCQCESTDRKMEYGSTSRGFGYFLGVDLYGYPYSLQASSLASKEAIWVGGEHATCPDWPRCKRPEGCRFTDLHVDASEYPWLDGAIHISARAHLDREQARELGEKLLSWADGGDDFWAEQREEDENDE